jgi:DNA polymerase III alpha subunit
LENILNYSKNIQRNKESNQISLFGTDTLAPTTVPLVESLPATKKQRLQWEKELLGLYVSDHPAGDYQEYLEKMAVPIRNIEKKMVGSKIRLGGIITKAQKVFLKSQKNMLFVTLEDIQGRIELLIFPKILENTESLWQEDKIVLVEGTLSDKDGNFKLMVDSGKEINEQELENFKRAEATRKKNGNKSVEEKSKMIITLPNNTSKETFKKLSEIFDQCDSGNVKIYLKIKDSKLETPYSIKNTADILPAVRKIVPESKIDIF